MSESPGKVLLEMKGIGKTFPGVKALEGVSLTLSLIHISEPTRPY